jgi:multidrug efflux system membrane fusion protein
MNYRRSPCLVGLLMATVSMALSSCGHPADSGGSDKPPVVLVVEPKIDNVQYYEYFTGRSQATETVEVRARVTGYLDEVLFKPGQEVKKGDLLFKIDPRTYKAQLKQDEGHINLSEAQLKLAEAELKRTLSAGIGTSEADKEKAQASKDSAAASLTAAKASVEKSKLNVEFCEIKSPIAGIIGRNLLTVGNLVTQDSTLLATIVSEDPMDAYFDVDERTMLRVQAAIREGKIPQATEKDKYLVEFGLTTDGDKYPHQGFIDFVNNQVDSSTGTINIRGVLPNPKPEKGDTRLLKPGLFLSVRVPIGPKRESMLVPQAAVGTDQGRKYLLVVNEKNVVEYRPVNAGPIQPNGMQVVEPVKIVQTEKGYHLAGKNESGEDSLKPSDKVIVSGLQRVRQGITVEARPYAAGEE